MLLEQGVGCQCLHVGYWVWSSGPETGKVEAVYAGGEGIQCRICMLEAIEFSEMERG